MKNNEPNGINKLIAHLPSELWHQPSQAVKDGLRPRKDILRDKKRNAKKKAKVSNV